MTWWQGFKKAHSLSTDLGAVSFLIFVSLCVGFITIMSGMLLASMAIECFQRLFT